MNCDESTTNSRLDSASIIDKSDNLQKYSFLTQAVILSLVVITSLVNLSLPGQSRADLWLSLLTLSIGIILPKSPKIKRSAKKIDILP